MQVGKDDLGVSYLMIPLCPNVLDSGLLPI